MNDDTIFEEAVEWVAALKRDDADWNAFTHWLEAAPTHRDAYDAMALLDERIDAQRATLATLLMPEEPPARLARTWWLWSGGAGIATAAALAGLMLLPAPASKEQVYRTAPGQTQEIALADGSDIRLASASSLSVKDGGRQLALEGTASFDVPHRPDRSLTIEAGGLSIQDIGTRFEVATGGQAVRVAVADGQVAVAAPELSQPVRVSGGKKLVVDRAAGTAELRPMGEFASWRHGRLVYDNAPLPLVAAEVGRYAGRHVTLSPELASRRFSGVLTIGDGNRLVGDLANLMQLDARADGTVVRLAGHSGRP
ncbi:MAG TPA: FecR domain-containing protein [Sphingomonas sp.]|nr:FecR domain-containing protein [Sphingomonas sp.]